MIIAGQNKLILSKVVNSSDGKPTISGVSNTLIWRESDGFYWDGSAWVSSGVSAGTPTHKFLGNWQYVLSGTATSGITDDTIFFDMTDSLVPASVTTTAAGGEHKVRSGEPADRSQVFLVGDLVESQRGAHTWQDNEYLYVAPNTGGTLVSGFDGSREKPFNTVTEALSKVSDSNHSVIFLVSDAPSGPTTLTEAVTINKRYTFIRGPGRDFIWTRGNVGDTITVTADGVELHGFQIQTFNGGVSKGVYVNNADFVKIKRCWVGDTRGHGIHVTGSDNCQIVENTLQNSGTSGAGHGVVVDGAGGNYTRIMDNIISNVAGDGVRIGGATTDCLIIRNTIHGCANWGINILAGTETIVHSNHLGLNTDGNIQDAGTDTILHQNEPWATEARQITISGDIAALPQLTDLATVSGIDEYLVSGHGAGSWTTSTLTESGISNAVDGVLTTAHGAGSWQDSGSIDANAVASGVWNAAASGYNTSGTMGALQNAPPVDVSGVNVHVYEAVPG